MKDCPSTRAFIAAPDDSEDEGEAIDSAATTKDLLSLLVQRVLTSKAEHEDEEKIQRKNLFHMFLQVKDSRVLTKLIAGVAATW